MTKAQKAALRFAYDLLQGRFNEQLNTLPAIRVIVPSEQTPTANSGLWLEPDRDTERDYLNEAICSALVVRGYLECREFPPNRLWLYRITPEGCAALGKMYPGAPGRQQTLPTKFRRQHQRHRIAPQRPDHRDPHRFRRSNDWRKG
jgi:hypothetical protein